MSEAWKSGSDTRWRTFRAALMSQWAAQGRTSCERRGSTCTLKVEQVDHIVPLALGGPKYDPANCRPSCAPCNRGNVASGVSQPAPRPVSTW